MKQASILLFIISISLSSLAQDALKFENKNYKPEVLSGYWENESLTDNFPMLALNSNQKLTFHFDIKTNSPQTYNYTLIHCEESWEASDLFESEYLEGFSEQNIDFDKYSKNTDITYVHYQVSLPGEQMQITKSGNYVLLVYEDFDKSKLVLTRRFFVVEDQLILDIEARVAQSTNIRRTHHEFIGEVDISPLKSGNPDRELSFRLIKNYDYDKDYIKLKTDFIGNRKLRFRAFQNNIAAGNEFRVFDIRTISKRGMGVYKNVMRNGRKHVILTPGGVRSSAPYIQYPDHDGKFFIQGENWQNANYETDYLMTHFYLNCEAPFKNGKVFIFGELTNWNYIPEAEMRYSEKSNQYVGELELKQGIYDYAFVFIPDDSNFANWEKIEGNYTDTRNEYLLLVYFKPATANYQKLIGVKRFNYH